MFKKSLATAALAVIAVFAFAPAANAADYTPATGGTANSSIVAGADVPVSFPVGAFTLGESVDIEVVGDHVATLSVVKAAVSAPFSRTANSAGVQFTVTLPTNATGTYVVTAVGATSLNSHTVSLPVVPADAGAAAKVLESTGFNAPVLVIWGAAGILLLGVALVIVRRSVRRQNAAA